MSPHTNTYQYNTHNPVINGQLVEDVLSSDQYAICSDQYAIDRAICTINLQVNTYSRWRSG